MCINVKKAFSSQSSLKQFLDVGFDVLLSLLEGACIVSVIAFNRLAFLDQRERVFQILIDMSETLAYLGHVHVQVPDQLSRTHRINVDVLRVIVKHVLDL